MKKKKIWKGVIISSFFLGLFSPLSIGVSRNFDIQKNENLNEKAEQVVKEFESKNTSLEHKVIAADRVNNSPILVESAGPIVSYGSKIYGLDWFAGQRWVIDLMSEENKEYFPGKLNTDFGNDDDYPKRAFRNWTLDVQKNELWILTNSQKVSCGNDRKAVGPQTVICYDSLTGKFKTYKTLKVDNFQEVDPHGHINRFRLYEQISVLKNGNILVYSFSQWWKAQLIDLKNDTISIIDSKSSNQNIIDFIVNDARKESEGNGGEDGGIRLYNIIPIAENTNIAVLGSILESESDGRKATGNLYLALVDDNFSSIQVSDTSSPWYFNSDKTKGMIVVKNSQKEDNNTLSKNYKLDSYVSSFSRSYYYSLDGNVVTTMFSDFFIFKKPTYSESRKYGVEFAVNNFGKKAEISSFTMDVNGNIFYKLKNDTKLYKMIIRIEDEFENTSFAINTYYDISSNNNESIKDNAENFILYNVAGYSGSIMLISTNNDVDGNLSKGSVSNVKDIQENNGSQINSKKVWGMALAVIPNKNNQSAGDALGLLNTSQSILKTADFLIEEQILKTKLPSEIIRDDLTILNDGFFTRNNEKNPDGTLKYPPFSLKNINDESGLFEVEVNLDQIPWFTDTLPTNSKPKKITKKFGGNGSIKIVDKVSWKEQNDLSYDFKNTLPSKATLEDLENFDPFNVSFISRTVLESDGSIKYPKKTYKITNTNDSNGKITVSVKYEYMPVSSEVNTKLEYNATHDYTIFNNQTNKIFHFAGATSSASSQNQKIDVKNVPQLKYLSESNKLPSSFDGMSKNNFLPFIDTEKSAGFPLSKMNFEVKPDDEKGELTIVAKMERGYYDQEYIFTQTYYGLNKKSNYNFSYTDVKTINGQDISTILPSSINEGDIINQFIIYNGFNSSDFTVNLFPENDTGTLTVKISVDERYPSSLLSAFGFENHSIQKTYKGFMTNEEFNNQYNITFHDDSSSNLIDLKKLSLSEIDQKLKEQNLMIGNVKYSNLNELVEKLFIKNKGVRIPSDWSNYSDNKKIESIMTYNNQSGTMNLSITIKKELLSSLSSDLNFVVSYSGFTKGNKEVTNDNLSFVSQELLKTVVPELENKTAKEMEQWLKIKENLEKILFSCTGQYKDFINGNNYELLTEVNDAYNSISITIKFTGTLTNNQSLTTYSTQYIL